MSFSYSGDPTSSELDAIRFALTDTDVNSAVLQDEEINYIISITNTYSTRLALSFRQAATFFGKRLVKKSLGPQSEDATSRHNYFIEMANKYEKQTSFSGTPPLPVYESEKVFGKAMMANT